MLEELHVTGWTQQVDIANKLSSPAIGFNVTQGSILEPILFLVYVNDTNQAVDPEKLILFSDVTTLTAVSERNVE